jgi:hypothetical protein
MDITIDPTFVTLTTNSFLDTAHDVAYDIVTLGGLLPAWTFPLIYALVAFYATLWLALDSLTRFVEPVTGTPAGA